MKKIFPSSATSIDVGACNLSAIISTPLPLVKLLEFNTGEGNGTTVSEGENFIVNMLTIIIRTEGITSRSSCLLSMSCIRFDFL